MLMQTSRHLWLQQKDERVLVSNVCSGRRALLTTNELPALERFVDGAPHDESPLTRRLVEADLIVPMNPSSQLSADNERAKAVLFALDKFLAERLGVGRSRLIKQMPDVDDRLTAARDMVIPELSKVLIGTRMVTRRQASDDFASAIDHVRTFLRNDAPDAGGYAFAPGFLSATAARPLPRRDYEQQPCLPHTTQQRVELARKSLSRDGRCLILGDDDLIGLYWSQQLDQPADIFEIDCDLLDFLQPRLAPHVGLHQRDLTHGLPEEFHGLYDCIFTDPMYEAAGMALFLKCCCQGLSNRPGARVYFSTRPDLTHADEQLYARFQSAGLVLVEHLRNFNRYPFADFVRQVILRDFQVCNAPVQLVDGLLNAPYLYADLFVLERA